MRISAMDVSSYVGNNARRDKPKRQHHTELNYDYDGVLVVVCNIVVEPRQ